MRPAIRFWVPLLMVALWPNPVASELVRGYLTTGAWYPRDPAQLNRLLDRCFSGVRTSLDPDAVRGLVVPHAGLIHSGGIAARGYIHFQGRKDIRRVILLGVSHSGNFSGACVSSFAYNATPLGKIPLDREVIRSLGKAPKFQVNNHVMLQEHSLENQLPFLQRVLAGVDFKLVPILFGRVTPAEAESLAATIAPFMDAHTVVVASSDLTHYGSRFGFAPFKSGVAERLHRLDRGLLEKVAALDHPGYYDYLQRTGMTMCGVVPVAVWMHLFKAQPHVLKTIAYATSGDANGDYSVSVGYGVVVAARKKEAEMKISAEEGSVLLSIARRTLEAALDVRESESVLEGVEFTAAMKRRAGVFVTLKRNGALRGCIGSIVGTRPLFEGVMANARNAAFEDPRFPGLSASELKDLQIEISVMTPLQTIADYRSIRLGTDGVVIRMGGASAVYLPQVATETGWDLDTFLASLCQKAGLSPRAYRLPEMEFRIFQAQIFSEENH